MILDDDDTIVLCVVVVGIKVGSNEPSEESGVATGGTEHFVEQSRTGLSLQVIKP